jgi:hypothetical protein
VLLGPILLVTATCLLVYGGTRMRTGAEPSLAVLAGVAGVSLVGSRSQAPAPLGGSVTGA